MPRLAKVVNVLAIRQVKQKTETARFRIVSFVFVEGFVAILYIAEVFS